MGEGRSRNCGFHLKGMRKGKRNFETIVALSYRLVHRGVGQAVLQKVHRAANPCGELGIAVPKVLERLSPLRI